MRSKVSGLSAVERRFAKAPENISAAGRRSVAQGSLVVRAALSKHLTGRKGFDPFWGVTSPEGPFLAGRTGQTRQRLSPGGMGATFRSGTGWRAAVGSPDAHVLLHDEGGTVPGPHRILTAAAQRRGSGTPKWPTGNIPGAFLWPNAKQLAGGKMKAKHRWIARSNGGRLELLVLLYDQPVRHRARHIFRTVQRATAPEVARIGLATITAREVFRG